MPHPTSDSAFSVTSGDNLNTKMSNLVLDYPASDVQSQVSSLKKRRHRELDRCWNLVDKSEDTLLAVCSRGKDDSDSRSVKSSNNKRTIKLQKKMLNKMCLEVDLAKQ